MGLSEVADFARSFAVMVRIQGPDPKGLKMRNHAFHYSNLGRTTLSASGMLFLGNNQISSGAIFVLTVASVVEPFLIQKLRESTIKDKTLLIAGVQIDVLVEGKSIVDDTDDEGNKDCWLPAELLDIVEIHQSSSAIQSLVEASCVSSENCWEVGWSLASHNHGPQHTTSSSHTQVEESSFWSQWHTLRKSLSCPSLIGQSATRVALLSVPFKPSLQNFSKLQGSIPKRGDLLLAMGSPFGILSPVHFFNNISVGSVGNCYPLNPVGRSLLMADIRCLPGMEGSPVFDEHAHFVGLLTRPLRQKISGTEIQLVIPWEAIASSCIDLLQGEPHTVLKGIGYKSDSPLPSPVEKATASICLITTDDGSWASGILLNKQGLVLTNAHLLEPWRFGKTAAGAERIATKTERLETFYGGNSGQISLPKNLKASDISPGEGKSASSRQSSSRISRRRVRVRLDYMYPWLWTDASIVYISKGPLDIALLQIENAPDQLRPIVTDFSFPSSGSKAYVIGHCLFGPRCDFQPSVCLGIISKVIEVKAASWDRPDQPNLPERFPAMLETTAAVHPGSSGGAVVNASGDMIGLVTSNAKHGGGTVIPHLNFSIPCAALEPIFRFARDSQHLSILEELDKPNDHLSSVWALMTPLNPKPSPLFPDIPQTVVEDNTKESKGSRFSKFIAERNMLLKNAALLSRNNSSSVEFMCSKL